MHSADNAAFAGLTGEGVAFIGFVGRHPAVLWEESSPSHHKIYFILAFARVKHQGLDKEPTTFITTCYRSINL